ncbi:MAG: hypothetical protein KY454_02950 [Actinobacteria bacterium]|nr:hypothetical protein [Actinomycetota bacterium]MBW3650466.1 hypothetical protein [Actinomycetota bacterium]
MPRLRCAVAVVAVVASSHLAACGSDRTGGLRGAPAAVVGAAPDRTVAAGTARIVATSRTATVEASVDLRTGRGKGQLLARGLPRQGALVRLDYRGAYEGSAAAATPDAELARAVPEELLGTGLQPGNPVAVLDLLRGASKVEPYGGTAVRGVATQRYSIQIDASRVPAAAALGVELVRAEVWIDDAGRVRRVQLGNDLRDQTTTTDREGLLPVTVVDLVGFDEGDS